VDVFRPERWLDEPEAKLKAMERAYMPVSWNCIPPHDSAKDL